MEYRLSPSDLTFLYEGCKHCFVLKVKHGIPQPSIPIPGVFSIIGSLQKEYYSGMRTEEFCPDLPPGVITYGEKRVRSNPLPVTDSDSTFYINGRFDIVAEFDDGTFGVLDFKTGKPTDEKAEMYARQLHAYTVALESPAEGYLSLLPVTRLGLLYFTPDRCEHDGQTRQVLEGEMQWVEIKRDDDAFKSFLKRVVRLLDGPLPELAADTCDWCRYLETTSSYGVGEDGTGIPDCPVCGSGMRLRTGKYGEFWSCIKYPGCKGTRSL